MADIYTYITYAQARQQLANRLYDSTKQFWSDTELKSLLTEALRTWNALTSFWRGDFTFPTQQGVTWYDLTDSTNLPNTLRPLTVTDAALYRDIQFALLEPSVGVNPWTGVSTQFTADDLVNAVQRRRDEILSVTGCTTTRRLVGAVAGRITLPDTVIDVRRMAYLPASFIVVTDDFSRADENPILAPWTAAGAFPVTQLLNNTMVVGGLPLLSYIALYTGFVWASDQFVQATITQFKQGAGFIAWVLRCDATAQNFYYVDLDASPAFGGIGRGTPLNIQKRLGGVLQGPPYATLGYFVPQIGDVFKVQIVGATISVYQNGALLGTFTDTTSPITSGSAGLLLQSAAGIAAVTDVAVDNFVGGSAGGSIPSPMHLDDTWGEQSFQPDYLQLPPGIPFTYMLSTQPPISFDVDVPPVSAGSYELLTVEAGPVLDPTTPTSLIVPDDWTHLIKWGALADLLSRESNAKDSSRAQYCEQRYRMGMALLGKAPALLATRVANKPMQIASVRDADLYRVGWQAEIFSEPDTALHSGLNLIALAPAPDSEPHSITATVVKNAPIPVADLDKLEVAREDLDAILDYAQHVASFKMGGQEFLSTIPLLERFMKQAALYNAKLLEMGEYTEPLYGLSQLQEQRAPRMVPEAESAT